MTGKADGIHFRFFGNGEARTGLGRPVRAACAALFLLSLLLLAALPEARTGVRALGNQLFAASERVNAYAYRRFSVPEGQSAKTAAVLLGLTLLALGGLCVTAKGRALPLILAGALALSQAYFGLSLPMGGNVLLFLLLGLCCARKTLSLRSVLFCAAAVILLAGCVLLIHPGTDERIESLSEQARDILSSAALGESGTNREAMDEAMETRHVNTQSLLEGDGDAHPGKEYHLVTVEEEEISRPRWINYLRILFLLLLSVAVVILPFLPFLALNRRRQKAAAAREKFSSPDTSEAVCAMFRHAAAYLEDGGFGGQNRPFRSWPEAWQGRLPDGYAARYRESAALFEEAAYSDHALTPEQRTQMLSFLAETETLFFEKASWKKRLHLRWGKCLHE